MKLKERIDSILNLEKFSELNESQRNIISECILANCLIMSSDNVEKYLNIIRNNLVSIVDIGDGQYVKDDISYNGIVETKVANKPIDEEGMVFPLHFELRYKEFSTPLGRLTKSSLHEFGHLTVKKDKLDLNTGRKILNGGLEFDLGGLVINKDLKSDYGHMFSEILNELTTFLSFKAYMGYHEPNEKSEEKMRLFAEKNGLRVEQMPPQHLQILTKDFFESFTENALANDIIPEGTKNMFNPLYVKYTPLVRVVLNAFQNPMYSFEELRNAFESGKGLDATKDGQPINDLLYGYYNSTFYIKDMFDKVLGKDDSWENFCKEFDKKMYETKVDIDFVNSSLAIFSDFYSKRLVQFVNDGKITQEQMKSNLENFEKVLKKCQNFDDNAKEYKRTNY